MKKAITVLAPSFVLTSILAIASGLSAFAAAFPELSLATVQMLTALPSLIGMPIILLSGALCSCFSKKEIVTASISLMIIGGLGPLLFHNAFYQLVIFSVLFGIGFGGISPLTTALIREHFSADQQQTMLGYQSAVIGIGGALFSFLGGKLASDCWWHTYFAYLLLLPVLFLILLQPAGEPQTQRQSAYRSICSGDLPFYLCQSVLFAMLFFAFQNNVALLLEHRALGNTSVSGRILAVQSTVGILSGVLGGKILSKLKKFALPTIFLVSGFAMLLSLFRQPHFLLLPNRRYAWLCIFSSYASRISKGHCLRRSISSHHGDCPVLRIQLPGTVSFSHLCQCFERLLGWTAGTQCPGTASRRSCIRVL